MAQRDLIEMELIALGEDYISRMPSMEVLHEDAAINYNSRYIKEGSRYVTCTTYKVPDMTTEALKGMREDGLEHQHKMAKRMRCWKLETEEGDRDIIVMRTLTPFPISNRFMISCLYHHERENG